MPTTAVSRILRELEQTVKNGKKRHLNRQATDSRDDFTGSRAERENSSGGSAISDFEHFADNTETLLTQLRLDRVIFAVASSVDARNARFPCHVKPDEPEMVSRFR